MPIMPASRPPRPPLARLARRIHQHLGAPRLAVPQGLSYALECLIHRGQQLAVLRHRLDLCAGHQLVLAAAKVHEELTSLLRGFEPELQQLMAQLPKPAQVLPVQEIHKELEHLTEEFPDWRYEPDTRTLVMVTEPITLEDLYLGPFEIHLGLDRLSRSSRSSAYKITAVEPHPAASNDAVTHPHVSDQHLCEGDAAAPITAALAEGRLGDFFILVRCVLTTYNPSSPYVALDQWEGTPCHDCGYTVSDDDRYGCEGCDHDFCESCMSCCRCCDQSLCLGCLDECPECQARVCHDCLERCSRCGQRCCTSCLEPEAGTTGHRCPTCRSAAVEEESLPPAQGDLDASPSSTVASATTGAAGGHRHEATPANSARPALEPVAGPAAEAAPPTAIRGTLSRRRCRGTRRRRSGAAPRRATPRPSLRRRAQAA